MVYIRKTKKIETVDDIEKKIENIKIEPEVVADKKVVEKTKMKFPNKNMVVLQGDKVFSPKTGRPIQINGSIFNKLLKEFEYEELQNILIPRKDIEYVFNDKLERYVVVSPKKTV